MGNEDFSIRAILSLVDQGFTAGLDSAAAKAKSFADGSRISMEGVGTGMTVAGAAITAMGVTSIKSFGQFEASLNQAAVVAGGTAKDIGQLDDLANKMGADLPLSAQDCADAMIEMARNGASIKDIKNQFPAIAQASTAAGADIKATAGVVQEAMNIWGKSLESPQQAAAILVQTANASNASVEDMQQALATIGGSAGQAGMSLQVTSEAIGLLTNKGFSAAQASMDLNHAILQMMAPSKVAKDTMQDLGISFTDAQGKMKKFPDILRELNSALNGLNPDEKAQKLKAMFGTAGMQAIVPLLDTVKNKTDDAKVSWDAYAKEQDKAAGSTKKANASLKEQANEMQKNVGSSIEQLGGNWESLRNKSMKSAQDINGASIKNANAMLQWATDSNSATAQFIRGFIGLSPAIGTATTSVGLFLRNARTIAGVVGSGVTGISNFIKVGAGIVQVASGAKTATEAFGALAGSSKLAAVAQWAFNSAILANPITWIVVGIATVVAALALFFTQTKTGRQLWSNFISWLKNAWNTIAQTAQNVWNSVVQIFNGAVNGVRSAWNGIASFFSGLWNSIASVTGTIWNGIVQAFNIYVNVVKGFWSGIASFFSNLWNSIVSVAKTIWQGLVTFFNPLVTAIANTWRTLVTVVQNVWKSIVDGVKPIISALENYFSALAEFYRTIWTGIVTVARVIWQGLVNVARTVVSTIEAVWNGIKAFFTALWTSIVTVARVVWQGLVIAFSAIVATVRAVWNPIRAFFTALWTGIVAVARTVWNGLVAVFRTIVAVIRAIWTPIRAFFTVLWQGIVIVTRTAWNGLRAYISTVFRVIQTIIRAGMTIIRTVFTTGWRILTTIVSAVWKAITTVISTAINAVAGIIRAITAAIQGNWSAAWNAIRGVAQTVWSGITSIVTTGINAVRSIVQSVMNAVQNIFSTVWNAIRNIFNTGVDFIKNAMNFSLFSQGQAIMNSLFDGLKNIWENIKSFVGGIGNWIKEHKGPISYDETLLIPAGIAIMSGLSNGLNTGFGDVQDLVTSVAGVIATRVRGVMTNAQQIMSESNLQLPEINSEQFSDSVDRLNANVRSNINSQIQVNNSNAMTRVNQLLEKIADKDPTMVLDDNTLVGKTTDKYNDSLGDRVARKDRWSNGR